MSEPAEDMPEKMRPALPCQAAASDRRAGDQAQARELLVHAKPDTYAINILVPKRRGEGFLKVPLGHHASALSGIAHEIEFDLYGLDGSLDVQTGFIWAQHRDALLERIMPPIAAHYGMGWRLVESDEYWSKHPLLKH